MQTTTTELATLDGRVHAEITQVKLLWPDGRIEYRDVQHDPGERLTAVHDLLERLNEGRGEAGLVKLAARRWADQADICKLVDAMEAARQIEESRWELRTASDRFISYVQP